MGDDKKCESGKKCCGITKFFAAIILLGGLAVGGSVAAAKFTGHPEYNLVTKIMNVVNSHAPQAEK
jgi:hypothetical protein